MPAFGRISLCYWRNPLSDTRYLTMFSRCSTMLLYSISGYRETLEGCHQRRIATMETSNLARLRICINGRVRHDRQFLRDFALIAFVTIVTSRQFPRQFRDVLHTASRDVSHFIALDFFLLFCFGISIRPLEECQVRFPPRVIGSCDAGS